MLSAVLQHPRWRCQQSQPTTARFSPGNICMAAQLSMPRIRRKSLTLRLRQEQQQQPLDWQQHGSVGQSLGPAGSL